MDQQLVINNYEYFLTDILPLFLNNNGFIKKVVDNIKKRVELRPDPSITLGQEKAEKEIK